MCGVKGYELTSGGRGGSVSPHSCSDPLGILLWRLSRSRQTEREREQETVLASRNVMWVCRGVVHVYRSSVFLLGVSCLLCLPSISRGCVRCARFAAGAGVQMACRRRALGHRSVHVDETRICRSRAGERKECRVGCYHRICYLRHGLAQRLSLDNDKSRCAMRLFYFSFYCFGWREGTQTSGFRFQRNWRLDSFLPSYFLFFYILPSVVLRTASLFPPTSSFPCLPYLDLIRRIYSYPMNTHPLLAGPLHPRKI
ncbi:hypothetical protein K438DRAFT_1862257 [Mycena galopus ATCC 62051]|nr:hypothetical protein K438DRAFT_1862257 [Mycena galopus ATCC 62051]